MTLPSSTTTSRGRLFLLLGLFFLCFLLSPSQVVADSNEHNDATGTVTTTTTTTKAKAQKSSLTFFLGDFFGILDEEEKDFLAGINAEEEDEFHDFKDDKDIDEQEEVEERQRKLQGGNTGGGSTSSTTSTRVNIWAKLKESLVATIIGFILIICMPCLIWKNEGRHVNELVRIDFAKKNAVQVECNSAGDDTLGQLVHFMGPVEVGDSYLDFSNGESNDGKGKLDLIEPLPKALILKRTCYIYQKFEQGQSSVDKDRIGGGETRQTTYTLKEDWTTTPQPATLEHLPDQTNSRGIWDSLLEASVNFQDDGSSPSPQIPEGLEKLGIVDTTKKPHAVIVAPSAKVGFFGLSRKIVMENMMQFGTETIPVPNENLPMTVSGCEGLLKGSDNILRNFPEGAEPFNGAVKVVFEYVQDGFDCSFVVQQTAGGQKGGDEEQPQDEAKFGVDRAVVEGKCSKDGLGDIWMVRKGRHSLEEMIDMAKEDEGKITKLLRILCWVGLMAGWVMLFSPFTTALSTLPILGGLGNFAVGVVALIVSCTCACTIMTAAYIRYRPLLAFGLLAIAGVIWGIVAWRLNDAAEQGGEPAT